MCVRNEYENPPSTQRSTQHAACLLVQEQIWSWSDRLSKSLVPTVHRYGGGRGKIGADPTVYQALDIVQSLLAYFKEAWRH